MHYLLPWTCLHFTACYINYLWFIEAFRGAQVPRNEVPKLAKPDEKKGVVKQATNGSSNKQQHQR